MLEESKRKTLTSLVIKGVCPKCGSNSLKYHEYVKNKKFSFHCSKCNWTDKYTNDDLKLTAYYWFQVEGNIDNLIDI